MRSRRCVAFLALCLFIPVWFVVLVVLVVCRFVGNVFVRLFVGLVVGLVVRLVVFVLVCLVACLVAWLLVCLLVCLLASSLACLPARLFACSPACVFRGRACLLACLCPSPSIRSAALTERYAPHMLDVSTGPLFFRHTSCSQLEWCPFLFPQFSFFVLNHMSIFLLFLFLFLDVSYPTFHLPLTCTRLLTFFFFQLSLLLHEFVYLPCSDFPVRFRVNASNQQHLVDLPLSSPRRAGSIFALRTAAPIR